jgi:SAM-dependent methyltransferase
MEIEEYRHMTRAGASHWWYRSTRALLRELATPHLAAVGEGTRFLDAGGGSGATGSWLATQATTVLDDVEQMALAVAVDEHTGYRGVQADIARLPHPDGTFAASLCVTVLCHRLIADPQAVVRELVRVTESGGLVILMEPGVRRLRRGHDEVTHSARRFSRRDLRDLMVGAELEVVRSTGAYSFLVPPAAALALLERGDAKSDVGRNESGMFGLFGALARIERAALRRVSLPFGLSVVAIGRKP